LAKDNARAKVEAVGGNFDEVMAGGCLTEPQCDKLFEHNLNVARKRVVDIYGDSFTCPCAKNVLIDLAYNMGRNILNSKDLETFNSLIKEGKWIPAAQALEKNPWCKQAG
jgi:GH24 family phage-related lysozyme (muramidase)